MRDQIVQQAVADIADPDLTSVGTLATIYGCCGLFDLCSDQDLMSLSFEGINKFMDWVGWEKTDVCLIKKNFVTWVRPEDTANSRSAGYLSNACGYSNSVEWGTCDFTLDDFALLRRHSPTRDVTKTNLRLCETQPRYRLDGSTILNDLEYDMRITTEGLIQDLKLMLITGDKSIAGQFDGFQKLIKTGYTNSKGYHCKIMDSVVIDWNSNGMNGGNGITWNGAAVAATWNFIDVLLAAYRRVRDRLSMAPALAGALVPGDMVLVAPTHILRCILNAYTCWSVCPGAVISEATVLQTMNTFEARTFRDRLNGGMFNNGRIFLDGFEIPLMAYDWNMMSGLDAQVFLLTGQIGGVKLISGQYNDLSKVATQTPEAMYSYTDGGRLLTWVERQKTCVYREVEFQPRLLMWAPWAQVRFDDVRCDSIAPLLSPDPWDANYPETSFSFARCDSDWNTIQLPT